MGKVRNTNNEKGSEEGKAEGTEGMVGWPWWLWSQLLDKLAFQPVSGLHFGACLLEPFCINLLLYVAHMHDGEDRHTVFVM